MEASRERRVEVLAVVRHAVGGIRTYLKYVYPHLPASRYHFTFLTVEAPESHLLSQDLAPHIVDIAHVPERRHTTGLLTALTRRLAKSPPDLIHSHGFTAGAIASIANLPFRLPHVMTSHDVFRDEHFSSALGPAKARLFSWALGQADVIQSVTFDAERNLIEYLPGIRRRTSLQVIVHGIDVNRFGGVQSGPPPARPDAWQVPAGAFAFGFLGRPMPQKGFEFLVDAVRKLSREPDLPGRFVVVVAGDGGYIREHRHAIEQAGLSDYFRFVGFTADVAPLLQMVDTVVIPSLWEACCLLAMEALVAGRPVIASQCVGLREVVTNSPALVVPPGDATALAGAMRSAMANHAALERAAHDFSDEARNRFDSSRVGVELDDCFQRALKDRRLPALGHARVVGPS